MGKNRTRPKAQNDLEALRPLDAGSSARGKREGPERPPFWKRVIKSGPRPRIPVRGPRAVVFGPGFSAPYFWPEPPLGRRPFCSLIRSFAQKGGAGQKELVSSDALRCKHRGPFPGAKVKGFLRVSSAVASVPGPRGVPSRFGGWPPYREQRSSGEIAGFRKLETSCSVKFVVLPRLASLLKMTRGTENLPGKAIFLR